AGRRTLIWLTLTVPAIAAAILWTGRRADHAVIARGDLEAPIGDSRATIRAIGPARFSRAQFQPDEIVRLDDGEIELAALFVGDRHSSDGITGAGVLHGQFQGVRHERSVTPRRKVRHQLLVGWLTRRQQRPKDLTHRWG
ncbi:hypothetical protein B4Q13_24215, partial [Lacticaseibacillus rhamnosus]